MTSWHGSIYGITGPLWGESTGHWWISVIKFQFMGFFFNASQSTLKNIRQMIYMNPPIAQIWAKRHNEQQNHVHILLDVLCRPTETPMGIALCIQYYINLTWKRMQFPGLPKRRPWISCWYWSRVAVETFDLEFLFRYIYSSYVHYSYITWVSWGSQIIGNSAVCSTAGSSQQLRMHQSFALMAFCGEGNPPRFSLGKGM